MTIGEKVMFFMTLIDSRMNYGLKGLLSAITILQRSKKFAELPAKQQGAVVGYAFRCLQEMTRAPVPVEVMQEGFTESALEVCR